jgi:hypothetical protein
MVIAGELQGVNGAVCDCGAKLKLDVWMSAGGYYLGYWCENCGPWSRESDYYPTRVAAEKALESEQMSLRSENTGCYNNSDRDCYTFIGNCCNFASYEIQYLRSNSKRITFRTFRKYVPDAMSFLRGIDAAGCDASKADVERSDWFCFYKGSLITLNSKPVVWMDWSGYEWIWQKVSSD